MITNDKITEFFCAMYEFCKEIDKEKGKKSLCRQTALISK